VGTHLRFFLHEHKAQYNAILINKEDLLNKEQLLQKLRNCDVVIHLAGMNRGQEDEVYATNVRLTKEIIFALDRTDKQPRVIFLSSTHNARDTAYGRSKRDCQDIISDWGKTKNASTVLIVAPNIFGEFAKPHYNSAVATFCHELSERKESVVNESGKVELVYVRDICAAIFNSITADTPLNTHLVRGMDLTISDVYDLLQSFRDQYFSSIVPLCSTIFQLRMFNTFRSYLYPRHFPVPLEIKSDSRGSFVEIAKTQLGGQTSFSTTYPGVVRGNHYHTRKIERFCVIRGEAIIKLRKLFTNQICEYKVSGAKPVYVDMPTYWTHSIENVGREELLTMFWINEIFDPYDPDTFAEPVTPSL
jgi:UDP-2-acetamido-2,6-beta-L-arabino-hexul-4-ose reductase